MDRKQMSGIEEQAEHSNQRRLKEKLVARTVAPKDHSEWLGVSASILTAASAGAALIIAVTTAPARSGPFCMVEPCIEYPYSDAAAHVPNDYYWMYPAFLIGPLFVVLTGLIYHIADDDRKIFGLIALAFAAISTTTLATNYFIQLTVVQPSLRRNELDSLSLFSQYNPHGIFIALEDVGYLMMSLALLFIAVTFESRGGLERAIKVGLLVSAILATGSLFVLAVLYGYDLEYRYEVVVLLIVWITLIVFGPLLAIAFKRTSNMRKEPG